MKTTVSDAAMTRAREFMGACDGRQWCVNHNDLPKNCQAYVEDLAALLDAYAAEAAPAIEARVREARAEVWDETAEEAYGWGWLHDWALADVKGRNPYREDEDNG